MITHHHVHTNGTTLHVASAGPLDGPLVILLHGFPEGWFAWRSYLEPLAMAGYRVLAPDQRGYGTSGKPSRVSDYSIDVLVDDVVGLIDGEGRKTAAIVGHDWGGAVAWWAAATKPERVERLAAINIPHPWVMRDFLLKHPRQMLKSWYVYFFQVPFVPERLFTRDGGRVGFERMARIARPGTFGPDDEAEYRAAWLEPGAMTAMMSWYRAAIRLALNPPEVDPRVHPKTLVLWGKQDALLGTEMVEPSLELCDEGRVVWFDDATHFVNHEEVDAITRELLSHLSGFDPSR